MAVPQRSYGVGLVASIVLVALMVGGCGGGAEPERPRSTANPTPTTVAAAPTPAPAPTPTPAPTSTPSPKLGGTLSFGLPFDLPVWDTFDVRGAFAQNPFSTVLNNLTMSDPYDVGKLIGDLAERWEVDSAGTGHTFFLRRGVKWHDGQPFTAKDVVYNVQRAWKPSSRTLTWNADKFRLLQSVEAADDSTVKMQLTQPSASFITGLSVAFFLMYPSHTPAEQWKDNPVGTGPYKFTSFARAQTFKVEKNPGYWKQGLPYLDSITYALALDRSTWLAAMRAGRIHGTTGTYGDNPVRGSTQILERENGYAFRPFSGGPHWLYFKQSAPWTDQRVRQAISLGMDREEINTAWLRGLGEPLASPMLPPHLGGQWGLPKDVMQKLPGFRADRKGEDIAEAKRLLTQAGVSPGTRARIVAGTTYPEEGELLQRQLTGLGFAATLDLAESAILTERQVQGDFEVTVIITSMAYDDPLDGIQRVITRAGAQNYQKWSNSSIEALYQDQDRTLDLAKRKDLIHRLQREMLDYAAATPIVIFRGVYGWGPKVKNYPSFPWPQYTSYRWEQVWLEQ